jgi:RNA polymerase sigma factor (sigma-70 family)
LVEESYNCANSREGQSVEPYALQADTSLELLAASGDGEAFGELYRRHADRTYDFVVRIIRDSDEAADIVQETFVRAMKSLKPGKQSASFTTWLFTIARNLCLTRLSAQKRVANKPSANADDEEPPDPLLHIVDNDRLANPVEAAQASGISDLVWSAAEMLSPKEASILDLHLRQDLDSAEIAKVLGISKGNAYTILSRLKSNFEEALVALTMQRSGRKECPELDGLLTSEGSSILSASLRRVISGHVKTCLVCQDVRSRLLSPTALFGSFAMVPMPLVIKGKIAEAIGRHWQAIGPAAGSGASLTQQVSHWGGRVGDFVGQQIRNLTVSWPYQTAFWKAAYLGVAVLTIASIAGGGGAAVSGGTGGNGGGPPTAVLSQSHTPGPASSTPTSDASVSGPIASTPTPTPRTPTSTALADTATPRTRTPTLTARTPTPSPVTSTATPTPTPRTPIPITLTPTPTPTPDAVILSVPPFGPRPPGRLGDVFGGSSCPGAAVTNDGFVNRDLGRLATKLAYDWTSCLTVIPIGGGPMGYSILETDTHELVAEEDVIVADVTYRVNRATANVMAGSADLTFMFTIQLRDQESTPIYWQLYETCIVQVGADCALSGGLSTGVHTGTFKGLSGCWTEGQLPGLPPCYTANLFTEAKIFANNLRNGPVGTAELDITIESLTFTRTPAGQ